jgi:zinc/manganese transport system substrate-binding protein
MRRLFWLVGAIVMMVGAALALAGCGSGGSGAAAGTGAVAASGGTLRVVAAENFWGSIAAQEAGSRAHVTSVIVNPNTDPHAYEPTAADARLMAGAQLVILNGAGYDPWGQKLISANPVKGRRVLVVGDLLDVKEGGNPHMWYSPSYVARVAAQITADLKSLDPADRAYFDRQHTHFMNVALKTYHQEISLIGQKYHGVPVGATESIFQYLAQALRLNLTTPNGFMKAISEGTEPTAQDKATFDRQIAQRQIKVLVFNSQNATPDVNALVSKAKSEKIPVTSITETLQPANVSFQAWQAAQLEALQRALAKAMGH